MAKKTIRIKESEIKQIVEQTLTELNWDAYYSVANQREKQGKHDSASKLRNAAKERFDDEFVGNLQYDTMGAKMKGKQSPKFHTNFSTSKPSIDATNSKGDHLVHHRSNGKDKYYDRNGVTTPEKFFRDKQVSNAYNKAMKALNSFNEQKIDKLVSDALRKTLNENASDYYERGLNNHFSQERLPKGWEKTTDNEGNTIYIDPDFNEFTKDEYGHFVPLDTQFNEQKKYGSKVNESNELYDEWYEVEDYAGNTGSEGMYRSYDIGTYYTGTAEEDAKESGFDSLEEYLQYWFEEVKNELPWYWSDDKAYKGETIFMNDGVVCTDLYGQILFSEYQVADARRDQAFQNKLEKGEYWTK